MPRVTDPLVHLDRRADGVALITLDNPKVNALSLALLGELEGHLDDLAADPPGAVVVTGGQRLFAAGADISEFGGRAQAEEIGDAIHRTLDKLAAMPRATIAAINGVALGGGCELALACDLRIAGESARLGQPEILLGVIPGGGGTQRLARLVGPSRAKDMVLTGRQVAADEAYRMGLIDLVVADDDVQSAALERAAELARGPLVAIALAKRAIDEGLDGDLAAGLALEKELFAEVFETEDSRIGVESFKTDGPGKAKFEGR